MRALVLLLLIGACSGSTHRLGARASLAAATATLACDWIQTRSQAVRGWRDYDESNPLLGRKPSPTTVDLYMMSTIAVTVAAWALLPARAQHAISAVAVWETQVVISNVPRTGWCTP